MKSEPKKPFDGQHRAWWAEWAKALGHATCPYLVRWVLGTPFGSARLHHWITGDDTRAFHDHSWPFFTFVLRGAYTDISPAGEQRMTAGTFAFRPAEHQHTVRVDPGGCWTIMLTGPERRFWGFWVKGKFIKARKYFAIHGHHPCS